LNLLREVVALNRFKSSREVQLSLEDDELDDEKSHSPLHNSRQRHAQDDNKQDKQGQNSKDTNDAGNYEDEIHGEMVRA
jgi:hypothetical protein